jgi:hypothetical protein
MRLRHFFRPAVSLSASQSEARLLRDVAADVVAKYL